MTAHLTRRMDWARRTTLLLTLVFCLFLAVTHLIEGRDVVFRILVSSLPLLILLPGVSRGSRRSMFFLSCILLIYFTAGVPALFAPGSAAAEALNLFFIITLFTSACLYMYWQGKAYDLNQKEGVKDS